MNRILLIGFVFLIFFISQANGEIIFEPYYSVSSNKSISPNRTKGTETEKISQREEKGIKAGVAFFRVLKLMLSVGQSFHVNTTTESVLKDEYDELDFSSELNSSTSGQQKKKKETQNRARISFVFDPSFWIFVFRTKLGVTAKQRIVKLYVDDILQSSQEPDPNYHPHAGIGFGLKFTPRMYFLVDYSFYFYKFPDTKIFERELSISYGISI